MANHVASMVTPGREPVKIQEEKEPDTFWAALGGKTEYHQSKIFEVGCVAGGGGGFRG